MGREKAGWNSLRYFDYSPLAARRLAFAEETDANFIPYHSATDLHGLFEEIRSETVQIQDYLERAWAG
jgi:hypothetical protein